MRRNTQPWDDDAYMGIGQTFAIPRRIRRNDALATKKYVKRCMTMQLEKKTIVVQNMIGNSGIPTSTGRVDPIQSYNIVQGTGDGNRTGNFVQVKGIWLRFICTLPTGTPYSTYRVVVFTDRQTNGSTPAITDVLETATGGIGAGYNDDNVTKVGGARFRVIRDKWFAVNSGVGASDATSASQGKAFQMYLKGPFTVHYKANAGAITDIVSGEIFVATLANGTNASIQCQVQIMFVDA